MCYLHYSAKVAHRDVKLENIMLDRNFNLKLIDFDIAKHYEPFHAEQEVTGTDLYVCPEAHRGLAYDLEKNDVFACGVVLYIMVIGRPPFFNKVSGFLYIYSFIFIQYNIANFK